MEVVNPCCCTPELREKNCEPVRPPWPCTGQHMGQPATATGTHHKCKVCGRNHYGLIIDPVRYQVKPS